MENDTINRNTTENMDENRMSEGTPGPEQDDELKSRKHKTKKESAEHEYRKKLEAAEDKYLRIYSEFDNYRKRTQRERIDLIKTANAEVITSLLPVLDDFERAIKSLENNADPVAIMEGINLVKNKLKRLLESSGLEEMNTIGKDFDTDFHEAITSIPAGTDEMKGKIVDEIEKGYLLNGKVIRFARVIIGK